MNTLLADDEEKRYASILSVKQDKVEQTPTAQLSVEEQSYASVINQKVESEREVLRQSLMMSVNKNPDQVAQIEKLAQQSGLPQPTVERNLAVVVAETRARELSEAARYSPILARQLADPKFASVAYDDSPALSGIEMILTKGRDYAGSLPKGALKAAGGVLSGFGELYGVGTRQLEAGLDQVLPNSVMSFLRTPVPWYVAPEQILKRPGQTIKDFADVIGAPKQRQGLDTDVIEGIGQLGFQIASWIMTGGTSATTMMLGQGADVMADKTRKDDASQSAKDAAIIAGAGITAMTERIGLDKILNRVPPEIRNRTLRFIADKSIAFGIEFAQETAEGLLHDLTRRVFTKEDAPILEGALREGTAAGLAAAIVRTALGVRGYRGAKEQEEFFRALGESSADSKLRQRLPEKFQDLVAKISENGPVQNVYIPANEFQRYYQEQGIDPAAKAAQFNAKNYTEAVAAGSDIVIPIDDFTTFLAPTDDLQGLFNDLRLEQGGMTAREFAEYQADEKARLDEIIQRAKEVAGEVQTPDLQAIKQEMLNQLIGTGYEQTTADAYATVYAKTISNLSERAGLSPRALHDKYNLSVNRPLPDVLTRDTRSDINIDPLLDRLRTGDLPTEAQIYGKSLTDFLLEKGGLRPVGELTDIDAGRGKFQKKLLNETGMSADAAAQIAVEAGYLMGKNADNVTESDLFDALNEEAAGTRQFSVNEINDQLMNLSKQIEGLDDYLRQLGIDLKQITDNAQVRKLIEQASQTPEGREVMDRLFQATTQEGREYPANKTVALGKFQTGQSVTFDFRHDTASATKMFGIPQAGDRFQRDLEPSGRYITEVDDATKVDTSGTVISGTITFDNPLVIDSTNWKQELSDFYNATGKNLSQALIAAGYDGVVTVDAATDKRPAATSEILDLTTFDVQKALYQQERGFIEFGKDRKFNITLLQNADLSTFLHETGHFYLEVLGDLAEMADSSQQIKDDYATVLKFLGLNSRAELTLDGKKPGSAEYKKAVAAHEKFARANELYLAEGKAPSAELRPIFQRFRQWLKLIYKEFTRLDVEINNQVRQVFDRIYATDEEIDAAKGEMSFDGLLLDAASAGMTEAEFAAYKTAVAQATESGKEALQVKLMKELQRERETFWKEESAKVREEVAAEVDATQVFIAFKELTEGDIKLNKDELVEQYGAEYVRNLPRGFKRVYTTGEGMPLDAAANLLGYPSGDALIEALAGMPNRNEYIKGETDRRMKERYGDIMTDGSIAEEAKIALHNSQREKVLATELRALRRKQREVAPFLAAERARAREGARAVMDMPPTSAFRLAAQGMIGQTAIRDLEPQRFLNAGRKQGKIAVKAMVDGDYATAADAKQKELLNHFLYLEARKARDRADKIAEYMRKFETKTTRERIGKAGATYLEQIDAILDGYEFRRIPNRQIDRRAMLNAFVAKMEASAQNDSEFSGEPVNIPQSVLDDGRQINYRLLSVDELEAVNEAVRNIANLAGLKNKLLRIQEKRSLDEIVGDAQEHIIANSKGGKAKKLESALPGESLKRWAKGFMLIHTKIATQFRQMDGWKDNGMLWNLFVRPLNERADYEAVERSKATKELRKIFGEFRDTSMMSKQFIPSLGQSMTLQGRLMVALNWGRAENRQRLMDGNGFSQQNIDEIFGTLNERDWKFVQNVWDYFDSYWPSIQEQYERLYGVAPEKSAALPFETKYGTMNGGYFPIKYDPTKSAQSNAQNADEILQQMKSGAFVRSQTKNGFTKEVLEKLDRPIKLDFSSIYEHLNEVIHDLALREYLLDTNKLFNHRVNGTTLKQTILDQYGDQYFREITDAIRDISIGDIGARNSFEQSMAHLRAGVSIVGMGWNLMTGLMQPLGLTQSMVRVGPKWIAKGLMKFGTDAVSLNNSAKVIYEKSAFMATRMMTQNREINEIRNQIKRSGKYPIAREAWGVIEDSYFQLIIQGQKLVDIPTWLGAEMKALENGADPETAIALADQAVIDAQGGGSIKDLAGIQRGSPLLKLWTNFYSYFNTTLNLTQESFGKTNFKDPISIGRLAGDLLMLYTAPAILGVALREAVSLLVGGEEKDEDELIEKLIKEQATYILGTMVGLREFASVFDPRFGYSGPAGARFIAEFTRFAKEVSQGELDEGLRKSAISAGGMLLHFPSGQLNRIIDGITALQEGKTSSPAAIIFGPPKD